MRRNRIAEEWSKFSKALCLERAPEIQRKEMRRAFYAEAHMLFCAILGGLTDGAEPKPEDMQMLDDLNAECEAFAESVKQGVA